MFKVGDKVKLPSRNTFGGGNYDLNICMSYLDAKKINQDYLYITSVHGTGVSTGVTSGRDQTFFDISDLELYEEFVLPDKWYVEGIGEHPIDKTGDLYTSLKRYTGSSRDFGFLKGYFYYLDDNNKFVWRTTENYLIENNYIKITVKDFQEHILSTDPNGYTTERQWINILLNQT